MESFFRNRYLHTGIVLAIDIAVSVLASVLVLLLMYLLLPGYVFTQTQTISWIATSFGASCIAFFSGRVYRAIIRYSSLRELGRMSIACLGKELLLWGGMVIYGGFRPESQLLMGMVGIDLMVTVFGVVFIRVAMVSFYDMLHRITRGEKPEETRNLLIYGVNDKSVAALSRFRHSSHYRVTGFITPGDPNRQRMLSGQEVYQFRDHDDVKRIVERSGAEGILFPNASDARREQDRLVAYCRSTGLKSYVIPGVDEITEGALLRSCIRRIRIEDLLGRPEIEISMKEIESEFNGKCVLVTGAAGSIGSELCRQLATFGVRRLVLFDNAETPLHNIRLELEDRFPHLNFSAIIGDVRSANRLDSVFHHYRPEIVFHAAAYKHVPLMEENPCEAVRVNVTGSRLVADKCVEYNVEKMVMVSTDKAVNPTNIMGCTKRLAEIYVQSLGLAIESGERKGRTTFVTTRFGNVLGSNGSVIPRFREQLEQGGPLTVTHPEIRRFFMTIPEACRLVMEAATFATGTQIFVFDMGEPVKIVKLAERMIELAGLEPGRDIRIEFTGLRPGEKLYEEILATKENTIPTQHSRIYVAKVRQYPLKEVFDVMQKLDRYAVDVTILDMVRLMKRTVPEFKSQHSEFALLDKEEYENVDFIKEVMEKDKKRTDNIQNSHGIYI